MVGSARRLRRRKTLDNQFARWTEKRIWQNIFVSLANAVGSPIQTIIDSFTVRAHRSAACGKRGWKVQGIGRSRGGRTTKIHAVTARYCRRVRFILKGGHVPFCVAAEPILRLLLPCVKIVQGGTGYASNSVRSQIEAAGASSNTPPKSNRRYKPSFSPAPYRDRNAVERMFGINRDFRRIGTSYDRRADELVAAVGLATIVSFWLRVRNLV